MSSDECVEKCFFDKAIVEFFEETTGIKGAVVKYIKRNDLSTGIKIQGSIEFTMENRIFNIYYYQQYKDRDNYKFTFTHDLLLDSYGYRTNAMSKLSIIQKREDNSLLQTLSRIQDFHDTGIPLLKNIYSKVNSHIFCRGKKKGIDFFEYNTRYQIYDIKGINGHPHHHNIVDFIINDEFIYFEDKFVSRMYSESKLPLAIAREEKRKKVKWKLANETLILFNDRCLRALFYHFYTKNTPPDDMIFLGSPFSKKRYAANSSVLLDEKEISSKGADELLDLLERTVSLYEMQTA